MSAISPRKAWLLLAASLTIHIVISRITSGQPALVKRSFEVDPPLPTTLLALPYDKWYDSTAPALKPFFIIFLLLILTFLFSFIGISASDFFCPNLSTVATQLGLSESTAGVTFLAFGNGSPDVFSTFASLRSGTFGLAIGELIGAASFIVSIVVGSIALIRPFHVPRHAFLRDVAFFTFAVIVLISVLADGHLTIYESGGMVMMYIAYVAVVVMGNWWGTRRRKGRDSAEMHMNVPSPSPLRLELSLPSPESALSSPGISSARRSRAHSMTQQSDSSDYPMDTPRPTFSLLGAIEFRDVVNSLKRESDTIYSRRSPSPRSNNGPPTGDYFGPAVAAYSHRRSSSQGFQRESNSHTRGRQRSATHHPIPGTSQRTDYHVTPEPNPWSDHLAVPSNKPDRPKLLIPDLGDHRVTASPAQDEVPIISVVDPSGTSNELPPDTPSSSESRFRIRRRTRKMLRVLFPSLQSFRHKSYIGMVLAIMSTPAILALTLTLPVVDDGRGDEGGVALPVIEDEGLNENINNLNVEQGEFDEDHLLSPTVGEGLHHLVDGGFSPLHSPLGRIHHSSMRRVNQEAEQESDEATKELLEEMEDETLDYQRGLTAVQCFFGPIFCTLVIFSGTNYLLWIIFGSGIAGFMIGILVFVKSIDGSHQPWRLIRCLCGFFCSMIWIAAIADEVVSVLRTVGEIFGLSDAIIGLTIFAVGNSLADLVANVTVAQFAPAMAYAACFGGPMLNLLLGVGGSGTYHMLVSKKHNNVPIDFSPTLWVSAGGLVLILVATAIFVPLNGYLIDRRWAGCLICAYLVVMAVNIGVEIKTGRD